jgi:hypothetical protein
VQQRRESPLPSLSRLLSTGHLVEPQRASKISLEKVTQQSSETRVEQVEQGIDTVFLSVSDHPHTSATIIDIPPSFFQPCLLDGPFRQTFENQQRHLMGKTTPSAHSPKQIQRNGSQMLTPNWRRRGRLVVRKVSTHGSRRPFVTPRRTMCRFFLAKRASKMSGSRK